MTRFPYLLLALLLMGGCQKPPTQFALIGDSPYGDENLPKYQRMIEQINDTDDLDWIIHLGDMKDSSSSCRDEALLRLYMLNQQFLVPFVLTPGDNDWFDCSRESAGGWDRLDRLNKLRDIFYTQQPELSLVSQSGSDTFKEFVENIYWHDKDVIFATVHLIGTSGEEGGMELHNHVQAAAIKWLDQVFEIAVHRNASAVFLATQADMYPFSGERSWLQAECPTCVGVRKHYESFQKALLRHGREFKKPILLAVGDTHVFRVDKPLYDGDDLIENFTRVEGFGEDTIHWVRIVVRPETSQVFEIRQEIIPENI